MKGVPALARLWPVRLSVVFAAAIVSFGVSPRGMFAAAVVQQAACDQCRAWQVDLQKATAEQDAAQAILDMAERRLQDYDEEGESLSRALANAGGASTELGRRLEVQLKDAHTKSDNAAAEVKHERDRVDELARAARVIREELERCNQHCSLKETSPDGKVSDRALCLECKEQERSVARLRSAIQAERSDQEDNLQRRDTLKKELASLPTWNVPERYALSEDLNKIEARIKAGPDTIRRLESALAEEIRELRLCNAGCFATYPESRPPVETVPLPSSLAADPAPPLNLPPPHELETALRSPKNNSSVIPPPVAPSGVVPLPAGDPAVFWRDCLSDNSCPPLQDDPFLTGFLGPDGPGGLALDPSDGSAWSTSDSASIQIRIQDKVVDIIIRRSELIAPYQPKDAGHWFDPLGLLVMNVFAFADRWRASIGPAPRISARDLEAADRVTNVQAAGLPKGVHLLLTDQGGSTGKTMVMNILNLSGRPVRLSSKPFAVQPIEQQAQQQVMQAFNRLSKVAPTRVELGAYCVEFFKAPPAANQLFRVAPAAVQQKYAPMSKILQSAYRVTTAGVLHPDSAPAAYEDSIKQWSIWTVEQNLNAARFADAFVAHTKKNVEAAGQKWSKDAEGLIRRAAPNRWQDIGLVIRGAGLPIPQ